MTATCYKQILAMCCLPVSDAPEVYSRELCAYLTQKRKMAAPYVKAE
uniref:Uncharacterized protein n=1 Tax=Anguilla anguilla TaxID=7936 RepID=A0A0E9QT49_ANGAN